MKRFADLAKEGWYGGDLDVDRNAKDLPLILRAEGLQAFDADIADCCQSARRIRSPQFELTAICIARTPYAWDLPVWLASGKLDAIELIHHHSLRDGVVDNENDGRPRDKSFFPGPRGNGRWSETVYYHVLNCGLRIPPVAGSGSGANDNPVGTNRVYVYCGNEFSDDSLVGRPARRAACSSPTARCCGRWSKASRPATCSTSTPASSLTLEIGLNLATRVPVEYLQIIKNGDGRSRSPAGRLERPQRPAAAGHVR